MDDLKPRLHHISFLTDEEAALVLSKWQFHKFPKHHLLIEEGGSFPYLCHIRKGAIRTFYYKQGKEITEWLSVDGFVSSQCFYRNRPSLLSIETIEATEAWMLHRDDMQFLCDQSHNIERMFREMAIDHILLTQERVDSFHFETAHQRYEKLLKTNPTLIQRIPLSYIASFLGMTQETLSRIRAVK